MRFPGTRLRQEFLEQVRLWNRVEALPTVRTAPARDGMRVRIWSGDDRLDVIHRLIDACGGCLEVGSRAGRVRDVV